MIATKIKNQDIYFDGKKSRPVSIKLCKNEKNKALWKWTHLNEALWKWTHLNETLWK